MKRTRRWLANERGLTLIEVMTSIVLFAMVTTILYSFLFMGISMYKRVAAESQLRSQVNLFYGQMLQFCESAVYVEPSKHYANELILIQKEAKISTSDLSTSENLDADLNYISYYAVRLDIDNQSIIKVPITGPGVADRDMSRAQMYTLDTDRYVLDDSSTVAVNQSVDPRTISVNFLFRNKANQLKNTETNTIQVKTEIDILSSQ
jgi:prepilin-type N-terminal cleavage/methylation domain-containing protein